jgi:hypothetical protein
MKRKGQNNNVRSKMKQKKAEKGGVERRGTTGEGRRRLKEGRRERRK